MKIDIKLLRDICKYPNEAEYIEKLYANLVGMDWWTDTEKVTNVEREKFLYKAFMEYYDIINNGEVKETETIETQKYQARLLLINKCKLQLEKELEQVRNYEYLEK